MRLDESLFLPSNDFHAHCYSCLKNRLPCTIDNATSTTNATATATRKSLLLFKNKKK